MIKINSATVKYERILTFHQSVLMTQLPCINFYRQTFGYMAPKVQGDFMVSSFFCQKSATVRSLPCGASGECSISDLVPFCVNCLFMVQIKHMIFKLTLLHRMVSHVFPF